MRLSNTRKSCSESASISRLFGTRFSRRTAPPSGDQRRQKKARALRRAFFGAAIAQRVGGELDGAVERVHQPGGHALDHRIVQPLQPFRGDLGAGEDIAQIVLDLGDRQSQRGQPGFLLQKAVKLALHGGELALGGADFVAARGGLQDARRVFRIVAEMDHGGGDALHRPHQDEIEADKDQKRGQQRNEERERQRPGGELKQRRADRVFVRHHHNAAARAEFGHGVDADDPAGRREERADHVLDLLDQIGLAAIIDRLDGRRLGAHKKELVLAAPPQDHGLDAGTGEQLQAQGGGQLLAGGFGEGQNHQLRGMDAVRQQLMVVTRDRGKIDQGDAQHHEQNGEQEEPSGQAVGGQLPALPRSFQFLQHGER
jgi:hypothetical protein